MEVALRTRQRKLYHFSRLPYHILGGKKEKRCSFLSIPRTHRSASHAAIITWHPGRAPELGKKLGTRRKNGHRTPAVPCISRRATSDPEFSFLTGTCGHPRAAPRLFPLSVLPPATMQAPAQPGLRARGGRRVIRGPRRFPVHLISLGTAVCYSYCPLKQMSVVVMRARPHKGPQEVSKRRPAIEHAQKNFRQEVTITQ